MLSTESLPATHGVSNGKIASDRDPASGSTGISWLGISLLEAFTTTTPGLQVEEYDTLMFTSDATCNHGTVISTSAQTVHLQRFPLAACQV